MYRVEGLGLEGLGIFSPQNDTVEANGEENGK